ncbi:MAG: ankyrin repeat domain-containing protein [Elusimicrobiota bacterium]
MKKIARLFVAAAAMSCAPGPWVYSAMTQIRAVQDIGEAPIAMPATQTLSFAGMNLFSLQSMSAMEPSIPTALLGSQAASAAQAEKSAVLTPQKTDAPTATAQTPPQPALTQSKSDAPKTIQALSKTAASFSRRIARRMGIANQRGRGLENSSKTKIGSFYDGSNYGGIGPAAPNADAALIVAAAAGRFDKVRMGLDFRGARINAQNKHGATALMAAAWHGHLRIAKFLLDRGADPGITDNDGWTALMGASYSGRLALLKVIPERGSDVAARDRFGNTALGIANQRGHKGAARFLSILAAKAPEKRLTPPPFPRRRGRQRGFASGQNLAALTSLSVFAAAAFIHPILVAGAGGIIGAALGGMGGFFLSVHLNTKAMDRTISSKDTAAGLAGELFTLILNIMRTVLLSVLGVGIGAVAGGVAASHWLAAHAALHAAALKSFLP